MSSHTQASLNQIIEAAVQKGSIASLCRQGGDPEGATYLLRAVRSNQTRIVRVLLQHGANPNYNRQRPGQEHFHQWRENPRHTDRAIDHGNVEMLELLLASGAYVGDCLTKYGTSLNNLLLYGHKSREIKLTICRMLVEHAKKEEENNNNNNNGTSIFLQTTLEQALVLNGKPGCEILLEAGVEPRRCGTALLYRTIRMNTVDICQLLLLYGVANPFLEEPEEEQQPSGAGVKKCTSNHNNNKQSTTPLAAPSSPFHAAARLTDTRFLELFLKHWDCSKCGREDDDGEYEYYPIQIIYRGGDDSSHHDVSLEAVQLIVAHACQADALMKAHGEHGLFPLHSAAMRNARLEVIFLLLKHWPSALLLGGHQLPSPRPK